MGLLDAFLKGTGDPEKDAAINQGLLNAGLALMQARGKLFPALGQAGQVGLQSANQYTQQQQAQKRAGLQDQMLKYQLGDQQRNAELAQLPGQFYKPPSQPGMDATGGMETALENPNNAAGPGGFDMQGYIQALMAKSPMQGLQLQAALKKDNTPFLVPKDAVALDPHTRTPVYNNVQPEKGTSDMQNYAQAVQQGYKGSLEQWITSMKRAGATQVNVPVNTERTWAGNVAEGLAKQDVTAIDAARSAPDRVRSAREVKRILQTETPITGTAADWRLAANKALSTAGLIDGSNVKSTEDLASTLASQTLDAIKTSGLGGGQGFTDKDRAFLEMAKSGRLEMNAGTLARIADLNEKAALRSMEYGNGVMARLRKSPAMANMLGQIEDVTLPADMMPAKMPTAADIAAEAARRARGR